MKLNMPGREVPTAGEWDVIVCGAGVAGIAAALSARRAGAQRVLLLEREFTPGGLATLGLITIYLPLCDGKGRQVSFGIAEELMRLSVSHGAEEELPPCWTGEGSVEERERHRCRCRFNAQMFACLAE
ncbi:MAG: FAD-dependent oxidoreductase, partial [Clostridia bacterium]|nr:FAD-dependent oxidoreductase [Clostridia bacterium]